MTERSRTAQPGELEASSEPDRAKSKTGQDRPSNGATEAAGGLARIARQVVWTAWMIIRPDSFMVTLGTLVTVLSLTKLVQYGLDYSGGHVIQLAIDAYDATLDTVFRDAEPFIQSGLERLQIWFGWELTLQPHWKHVFVLLEVYFLREVIINCAEKLYGAAVVNFIVGLFAAVLSGIGAGAIVPGPTHFTHNYLIGAIPIIGAFFYNRIGSVWDATRLREYYEKRDGKGALTGWNLYLSGFRIVLCRTCVGLVILSFGLMLPFFRTTPNPGLVMFGILVLAFGFYWLAKGIGDAVTKSGEGETIYQESVHTRLGLAIVRVFFYSALFFLADAGWTIAKQSS